MIGPAYTEEIVVLDMPGLLAPAARHLMLKGVEHGMNSADYEAWGTKYMFERGRVVVTFTFRRYNRHPVRADAVAAARHAACTDQDCCHVDGKCVKGMGR